MRRSMSSLWWRDSNQTASGKPGAVQIVLNERHLRTILLSYIDYYQRSRTHLALGKDTPERRSVQPAGAGKIVAFPQVGGLHHRYQRLAA